MCDETDYPITEAVENLCPQCSEKRSGLRTGSRPGSERSHPRDLGNTSIPPDDPAGSLFPILALYRGRLHVTSCDCRVNFVSGNGTTVETLRFPRVASW